MKVRDIKARQKRGMKIERFADDSGLIWTYWHKAGAYVKMTWRKPQTREELLASALATSAEHDRVMLEERVRQNDPDVQLVPADPVEQPTSELMDLMHQKPMPPDEVRRMDEHMKTIMDAVQVQQDFGVIKPPGSIA